MQDETKKWLNYSDENLEAAISLLKDELFNPCLQNIQQAVEKVLKALIIEKNLAFKKTHSIMELKFILVGNGISIEITEEECDFLDSIYLPTKYPIGSALPDFYPDIEICNKSISLAKTVIQDIKEILLNK